MSGRISEIIIDPKSNYTIFTKNRITRDRYKIIINDKQIQHQSLLRLNFNSVIKAKEYNDEATLLITRSVFTASYCDQLLFYNIVLKQCGCVLSNSENVLSKVMR